MLIRYSLERPENARYAGHARFLARAGVRVPRVLAEDRERNFLLLEDFGSDDLLALLRGASPARRAALYRRTLAAVRHWHDAATAAARRARLPLERPFAMTLYRAEHNLFLTHHVDARPGMTTARRNAAAAELERVARRLAARPRVLLHRDLQSTNIFPRRDGVGFIDFQGMRFGPAEYDLASLLCDPYVDLPATEQRQWLEEYVADRPDAEIFRRCFWFAAAQRLCQALGAYGRIGGDFTRHIPAAQRQLARALAAADMDLPALRELAEND